MTVEVRACASLDEYRDAIGAIGVFFDGRPDEEGAQRFAQTLPVDLAILFAGDTLMYLEILVAIRLAAGKELLAAALRLTIRLARFALSRMRNAVVDMSTRASTRERRTPSRIARPGRAADHSDDEEFFDTQDE